MSNPNFVIYGVHGAFWGAFGLTRVVLRSLDRKHEAPAVNAPVAEEQKTAPFSRALLALHMVAFGVMYFGVAQAVIPNQVPEWFFGQRLVGTGVIVGGAALMAWALVYFRSWRFRAQLDQGHQLATGGPFKLMRHPLYMGLNLLALGTALWVPTAIVWASVALMLLGSDLRGRAEEKLLQGTFGEPYRSYCASTRRFLPGIY